MVIRSRRIKKTAIEAAAEKLKEAHKAQDIAGIDTALAGLNAAWTAASEDIYKSQAEGAQQQQPGADAGAANQQAGGNGATANDNVTDVPYEEVK